MTDPEFDMSSHGPFDEYIDTTGLVDVIEEVRLRTWARLNYHAPEERNRKWHPIILDEMRRRDTESV